MIRAFLALNINNIEKEKILLIIRKCQVHYNDIIKWVEDNNLHFTYLFLGDIKESDVKTIIKILNDFERDLKVLDLNEYETKICFNNIHSPKILWLEYKAFKSTLKELDFFKKTRDSLIQKINSKLPYLDLLKETKPLKIHLTLGRVKYNTQQNKIKEIPEDLQKSLDNLNIKPILNKMSLIQSTLTPDGPVYKELYTINLNNN